MIFADGFTDAFNPKAVPPLVGLMGGQDALRIRKWIYPAGIYDGYYNKRRTGFPVCIDFNEGFGNAAGGLKSIVQ